MPFDISGKFEFRVENEDFSIFFSSFVQRSEKLFDYYFSIFLFIQFVNPILIIKSWPILSNSLYFIGWSNTRVEWIVKFLKLVKLPLSCRHVVYTPSLDELIGNLGRAS